MDVRQLTYFLAVVEHGGFTRAAEHLIIAQPSLSQTIKGLERELGVSLFHRIGRRVVLSEAGRALVGPARIVLRDLEVARSAAAELSETLSGRLEMIAMPSPAMEPLQGHCRQPGRRAAGPCARDAGSAGDRIGQTCRIARRIAVVRCKMEA